MASICFYFQVHQPMRVKRYRMFDIGGDHEYFSDDSATSLNNRAILEKVARKCYLPTNALMLELLQNHPQFRASYSLSGIFLEQARQWMPEIIESFRRLVDTGQVEILSETYYHSLSFLYSREEFRRQVATHDALIKELFGVVPRVFRNTELIYNNDLAQEVAAMGYTGVIAEGADHVLGWRSPNFLYHPAGAGFRPGSEQFDARQDVSVLSKRADRVRDPLRQPIKLLLKNYKLSDDIAFRFSSRDWPEHPLTAPKFSHWVNAINGNGNVVNLFMDYETFGEHQWEDTGIFSFLRALPAELLKHPDNDFVTPSEAIARYDAVAELDIPHFVSWADVERDLSAWLSNPIQHDAIRTLYELEEDVLKSRDKQLIEDWRRLQTSDHFYYMCTKWFSDGDVHKYFNPYESPYEAFIAYMNVIQDMKLRLQEKKKSQSEARNAKQIQNSKNKKNQNEVDSNRNYLSI